jgi:hypothetical protein
MFPGLKLFAHKEPKRIFFPFDDNERIKGWLLHCHKSRDRHDMTARSLDRQHRTVAVLSALFSALAGITVATNLDGRGAEILGISHLDFWTGLGIGVLALVASFLTLLQKEARYGERAEIHRRKAEAYKSLIWDFEQKLPLLHRPGSNIEEWSKQWHAIFTRIEEEQQAIVPQRIVAKVESKLYRAAIFVPRAEELLHDSETPPEACPATAERVR